MNVIHEGRNVSLKPRSYPLFSDLNFLLQLESSDKEEFIFLSIPKIYANISKILSTTYDLKIYESNHWQEKSFSKLRVKKDADFKEIGFLFPIATLALRDSVFWEEEGSITNIEVPPAVEAVVLDNADRSADEIARGHALAALFMLLASDDGQKKEISVAWGETYSLSDFYHDSLILGVYSTRRIDNNILVAREKIEQFSICLAEYKTFELRTRPLRRKDPDHPYVSVDVITLKLQVNVKYWPLIGYLKDHLIPYESIECDPIVRFFLQYQFFEMLMQEVFSGVIKEFLIKAAGDKYSVDAWKTKELVGKLNERSGENYRISKIFGLMRNNFKVETEDLDKSCLKLLKKSGKFSDTDDPEQKIPKVPYYKVRNLIFHGFGSNSIERSDIDEICECVSKIIFSLCVSFEDPKPYFELDV